MSSKKSFQLHWRWRFKGQGSKKPRANGILFTAPLPDRYGYFTIRSMTGKRLGVNIDKLWDSGTTIPGNVDVETNVGSKSDNKIRPLSAAEKNGQLTAHGINLSLEDKTFSNLFYADYLKEPTYREFLSRPPFPKGEVEPNQEKSVAFVAHIRKNKELSYKWKWQYSNQKGKPVSAKGHLVTNVQPDQEGYFKIKSLTGTRNGIEIDQLLKKASANAKNNHFSPKKDILIDNKIKTATSSDKLGQLTSNGLAFSLEDGSFSRLLQSAQAQKTNYLETHSQQSSTEGSVDPSAEHLLNFEATIIKVLL